MPTAKYVDRSRPRVKVTPRKHCFKKGDRVGMLVLLTSPWKYTDVRKGHVFVSARCDCGKSPLQFRVAHLADGTQSCGCLTVKRVREANTRHGESKTRLHRIWRGLRSRCNDPTNPGYANYGGRGIKVCSEWDSFESFRDWSLGNGYSDDLSIDRIDNDGNYAPDNCRWADRSTQSRNQRPTRTWRGQPCSSKYRGVTLKTGDSKWEASIRHRGKTVYLGRFTFEEDAARAYDNFARKYDLPANLNFPD